MSDRQASNVITSENSGDFYANKLGLADSPSPDPAETPSPEVEQPELTETKEEQSLPEAKEETKPAEEGARKPKLEKRFDKVIKERELARAEAQKEREQREALENRLKELEQASKPQVAENPDREPQPSDFTDAFEYAKALAKYSTEKALKDRDVAEKQKQVQAEREKMMTSWQSKLEQAKAELLDYDDMVASSDVVVSDQVRDAILESDVGPKILYHLAENPEVAEKISGMSLISALREIGKLEARFDKPVEAQKPAVRKSNAPAPINPIRGGSNVEVPIDSNGNFNGTPAQWKELRKAGKIR